MAIQFPKLSLELFLMKREAEVSAENTRRYIQWPEILNYDIEFWLAEATKEARKNPRGQVSEALMNLPPVFNSTDKRTWLATRKHEKTQPKANSKWLAQSVSVEEKPCANPASLCTDKNSWLAFNATPTAKPNRTAAGQENPLSKWLLKERQAEENSSSQAVKASCQPAVSNPWLISSYSAASQSKPSDREDDQWLAKPNNSCAASLTGSCYTASLTNSRTTSSISSRRTEQDKWLSRPGDADLSTYTWVTRTTSPLQASQDSSTPLEAVRKGLDSFTMTSTSLTAPVTLSESTSLTSVTSWLQSTQEEEQEDMKKWISGDEVSEGSIITLDSSTLETTEDIEDAVFVDKKELEKWLLHN